MGIKYSVYPAEQHNPDIGPYTGYGIEAISTSGEGQVIADISSRRGYVEDIAAALRKGEVSLDHFGDVVIDFILS